MAFRPCLTCGQPYFGASAYTYVTWFDGESRMAFRMSQCSHCAADLRNPICESADTRVDDTWAAAPGAPPLTAPVPAGPESVERLRSVGRKSA